MVAMKVTILAAVLIKMPFSGANQILKRVIKAGFNKRMVLVQKSHVSIC